MNTDRRYISEIRFRGAIPEDSYLYEIPAIRYLQEKKIFEFDKKLTFFVGENGSGKSTLLEAIAIANKFNPEGGSLNALYSTNDTHSNLNEHLHIIREKIPEYGYFLRAESMYNTFSYMADIFKMEIFMGTMVDYHTFSHGEAFLETVCGLCHSGLFIFDEPETALSPSKLLSFMCEVKRLLNMGSQFIIATHSPILMAFPNADIYQFTLNGIEKVSYTETEHYRVTKNFLDCPERMLKALFEE